MTQKFIHIIPPICKERLLHNKDTYNSYLNHLIVFADRTIGVYANSNLSFTSRVTIVPSNLNPLSALLRLLAFTASNLLSIIDFSKSHDTSPCIYTKQKSRPLGIIKNYTERTGIPRYHLSCLENRPLLLTQSLIQPTSVSP